MRADRRHTTGSRRRWPVASRGPVPVGLCFVVLLIGYGALADGRGQDPIEVPGGRAVARPEQFVGLWEYNSEDSRNLATGRPERGAPGTAAPRPIVPRITPATPGDAQSEDRRSPFAPSPHMLRENRDLARDLLEIAETLAFEISGETVTMTDDLGRSRTYTTDGRRQRYRLAAAEFFARVRWEDGRLRRDIEGTFGSFRMTETYFVSPDANRLFLIIRVGEPARGRPQAGVDRVYDRISPEER